MVMSDLQMKRLPVFQKEMKRKATQMRCKRGHEYTKENTYLHPQTGCRDCKRCISMRSKRGASS